VSNPAVFKLWILSHWASSKTNWVCRVEITTVSVFVLKLGLLFLCKEQAVTCVSPGGAKRHEQSHSIVHLWFSGNRGNRYLWIRVSSIKQWECLLSSSRVSCRIVCKCENWEILCPDIQKIFNVVPQHNLKGPVQAFCLSISLWMRRCAASQLVLQSLEERLPQLPCEFWITIYDLR